jgi:hypothetical protein
MDEVPDITSTNSLMADHFVRNQIVQIQDLHKKQSRKNEECTLNFFFQYKLFNVEIFFAKYRAVLFLNFYYSNLFISIFRVTFAVISELSGISFMLVPAP